jgi:hypothetical protein
VEISQKKQNMKEKLLPQKMITSTGCIYGKTFRLLSFEVKELYISFTWTENYQV